MGGEGSGVKGHHTSNAAASQALARLAPAVQEYTRMGYAPMNQLLRTGDVEGMPIDLREQLKPQIAAIDQYVAQAPKSPADTLYRGVSFRTANKRIEVGKVYEDKGFMSTSLTPEGAQLFKGTSGGILEIQSKHMGVDITSLSTGALDRAREAEVLLPRNTKLMILGIEKREGKPTIIKAKEL